MVKHVFIREKVANLMNKNITRILAPAGTSGRSEPINSSVVILDKLQV